MKKLSKINISAEKVLGNDELVNLRGGTAPHPTTCHCSTSSRLLPGILLPVGCTTELCTSECETVYASQYPEEIIIGLCAPGD